MEAKYPSKERVERDGVLVHAEGDDLINDPDEARRQGYDPDTEEGAVTRTATERIERDGVLIAAEGDVIPNVADDQPDGKKRGRKRTS
jgi:hypothetical protein